MVEAGDRWLLRPVVRFPEEPHGEIQPDNAQPRRLLLDVYADWAQLVDETACG